MLEGFADRPRAAGRSVTIGVPPPPPPPLATVDCDAARIPQVVANVVENSVRYTAAGGRVDVSGRVVAGALHVCIAESAPGVAAPAMASPGARHDRVEPSCSRVHGGTGLGLALPRRA